MPLKKLEWYGISSRWLKSCLSSRSQLVRRGIEGRLSIIQRISQRSIVRLIIFLVLFNDLTCLLPFSLLLSYAEDLPPDTALQQFISAADFDLISVSATVLPEMISKDPFSFKGYSKFTVHHTAYVKTCIVHTNIFNFFYKFSSNVCLGGFAGSEPSLSIACCAGPDPTTRSRNSSAMAEFYPNV